MKNTKKINVLIADKVNLLHLNKLRKSKFNISIKYGLTNDDLLLLSQSKNYKVLFIKSQRKIDKVFISRCNFEIICTASKGLDHIDTEYASKRNIKIIYSETGNTVSAAEHTLALIFASFKKLHQADFLVRQGKFNDWSYKRQTLDGKKIGIIGTGKVGSLVAKYAKAFGMEVLANDIDIRVVKNNRNLKYYTLDYLLKQSDVITVHIPLELKNRDFINKSCIDKMKNNIIFVNTSRGEVIDEDYLIKKAKTSTNFFIALDVFKNEPELNKELMHLKNSIYTNHAAGKTLEGEQSIGNDLFMQVNYLF
ncbi:MAG: NAD(P)-dependent oxidoreductase [Candidatus Kapaibacterium sp.]